MSLSKELLNRLVCAKYIFRKGAEILERGEPFASGISIIHFQDAAEIVLRVIAEKFHCSIKENSAFNQIMDAIDRIDNRRLTHRSALNQLNKARVNFKHFGLEPRFEDTKKIKNDLEGFLPNSLRTFLDIDYDSISLISLIGHTRTENFLKKAESLIAQGRYSESIAETAIAFTIFCSNSLTTIHSYRRNPFQQFGDSKLERWAEHIEDAVLNHQDQLNFIVHGINLSDYTRFQNYTPVVHFSDAGTYAVIHGVSGEPIDPTRDIAIFCLRFATDAIFLIKNNRLPSVYPMQEPERRFKVLKRSPIIVWPSKDIEIIRYAEVGETLLARSEKYDTPEYIAIIQNGDDAFVQRIGLTSSD